MRPTRRPPALPPAPALVIGAGARLNRLWLARGEGAPIVFIHGFGADLNGWRPLVGRLPVAYSALALDLPGHGASPFAGETTLAALTAAVAAALAEEGVAAAHLVGHSLGGAVAAALMTAPGFRALSLALISPAGLGPEVNGAFIAGFLRARSEASLSPWMRELVADPAALGSALVNTTLRQRAAAEAWSRRRRASLRRCSLTAHKRSTFVPGWPTSPFPPRSSSASRIAFFPPGRRRA